jgi:hypothetical protein
MRDQQTRRNRLARALARRAPALSAVLSVLIAMLVMSATALA